MIFTQTEKSICEICHTECGFIKNGGYFRTVIDGFSKYKKRIQRYLCKLEAAKGKMRTFSVLPESFIPYHRYTLEFIMIVMPIILSESLTREEQLNKISQIFPANSQIHNLESSHISHFKAIFHTAMNRYQALTGKGIRTVSDFFYHCQNFVYKQRRSWLAITEYFYLTFSRFLFGTASQHRCYSS